MPEPCLSDLFCCKKHLSVMAAGGGISGVLSDDSFVIPDNPSLDQVMANERMRFAFQTFLKRNYMSEVLEIWLDFEELKAQNDDQQKIYLFQRICAKYLMPGCRSPVNLSYEVIESLLTIFHEIETGQCQSLPLNLFAYFESDLFTLLEVSCLPPFIMSTTFSELQRGVYLTSEEEFSRIKAEFFFGMKIEGSLKRTEIVRNISSDRQRNYFVRTKRRNSDPSLTLKGGQNDTLIDDEMNVDHMAISLAPQINPVQDSIGMRQHGDGAVGFMDLFKK
jgi:hypothetical protein